MTKKAKLKVRDFAQRNRLTSDQRERLEKALAKASSAQTEVILRQAGHLLAGQRVVISTEEPEEPRLVQPAHLKSPISQGLVDPNGRPVTT